MNRTVGVLGAGALVLSTALLTQPAQAVHAHGPIVHLVASRTDAHGKVIKTYRVGKQTVTLTAHGGAARLVGVTDTQLPDGSWTAEATADFTSDPNDTAEYSAAQSQADALTDADPTTTAPAPGTTGSYLPAGWQAGDAVPADPTTTTSTTSGRPVDSWCVYNNASQNDVHAKTCAVRRLDFAHNGNQWYNDSVNGSAWTNDGQHGDGSCIDCDNLTAYAGWLYILDGGSIPDWSPNATANVGGCGTRTYTVDSSKTGIGYQASDTICPETFGPYGIGQYTTGAKWTYGNNGLGGLPQNTYRRLVFTDMYHSPRGVGTTTRLTAKVWWT